ncbi:MAG: MBL fold metallo-hydrolase [Ignavibacteria bacterium]|nr:MBL fold metallo-hydrolase [Ignavibacteria bacterium]
MKIGNYELHTVQTGLFKLDGGAMFGVVPKPLWSKTNPADEKNRIDMCMRSLLLISESKKILVDNGVGRKMSAKLNEIYGVDHSVYTLEGELEKLGIKPEEITDVILTHLHFDHAGGSTKLDKNNELVLTFPNAVHHLQKRHWEWGQNPSERDKASFMPENYNLIKEKGMLKLYDGESKFDEVISLHTVSGHTPFMQLLKLQDQNNTMLYTADLFPMTSHIPLPYIMGYDLYPLTTLEEKKKFESQIVKDNWLLYFEHDAFTETCRLEQTERGIKVIEKMELNKR